MTRFLKHPITQWIGALLVVIIGGYVVGLFPGQKPCDIQGTVYDTETSKPLSNVKILYFATGSSTGFELATTGLDGEFLADCQELRGFPLRLELKTSNWEANTDVLVTRQGKKGINLGIPVSKVLQETIKMKIFATYVGSR
jgi:hypothetical protein